MAGCGAVRAWQRTFYDDVIRSERALGDIRQYIVDNPLSWELDEENPTRRNGRSEV